MTRDFQKRVTLSLPRRLSRRAKGLCTKRQRFFASLRMTR